MSYREEDIVWLESGAEYVRARPKFFLSGGFHPADMCARLAGDALFLNAQRITIRVWNDWHIVSADKDWLKAGRHTPVQLDELFRQVVAFPEAGVNSMRCEVLLTAFASKVVCATSEERFVVTGDVEVDSAIWAQLCPPPMQRSVAFQV